MTPMRAIPKPAYARMQRARKRLKAAQLAANAVLVRERDANCRRCASTWRGLQVHHIRYRSQGGDHSTGNLVLVCQACHDAIHDKRLTVSGNADGMLTWREVTPKKTRRAA